MFLAMPRTKLFNCRLRRSTRSTGHSAGPSRVPSGDKTPEVPSPHSLEVEAEARGESHTSVDDTPREKPHSVQTATSKKLAISASCSSQGETSGDPIVSPPNAGFGCLLRVQAKAFASYHLSHCLRCSVRCVDALNVDLFSTLWRICLVGGV